MVVDVTKFNGVSTPNNPIFNKYMYEIAKLKPLSREEEIFLCKQIQETNDSYAFDKLCNHNLLFVVSVAKRYAPIISKTSSLTLEDLINEGNLGLCIAIRKFDYTKGNKLISYAVWHIRQQILMLIQNHFKSIRIPGHIRLLINKIKKVDDQLEQEFGRSPSTLEMFEKLLENGDISIKSTIDVDGLDEIIKIQKTELSLNVYVGDDNTSELCDLLKTNNDNPYQVLELKERKNIAFKLIEDLPIETKMYIKNLYGLDGYETLSYAEIGKKYDVLPQTVRNRVEKYLRKLKRKHYSYKDFLYPHLKRDIIG